MAKITPVLQTTILSLTFYVVSGRSEQFNDCIMAKLGTVYWRQRADERLSDPPPKIYPVVRDRDERPPRGLSGSALLLYV